MAAAIAVGVGLLVLAVPALHWQFGAPRLGLSLELTGSGGAAVTAVNPRGSAAAAGIQPGDTLVSVGRLDVPVPGAEGSGNRAVAFQLDVINGYREGEEAEWVVSRGGERRVLSGTFVGIPHSTVLSRMIVLGVFWALAWFLLWARGDRKTVRHLVFTIFALTASVLFLLNRRMGVDTPLGFAVHQVHILGGFLAPALVIHFGVIFPVSTLSRRARRRVLAATYGFYFVAAYLVPQYLFLRALGSPEAPYPLLLPAPLRAIRYDHIGHWIHILDFLVCGLFMLWTYRRVADETVRDRVKWVLWAVLLTAGVDVLAVAAARYTGFIGGADLYPFRNYLYLLIAAGLLIAVFRHDLFDVDAVIRGTVIYFGTVGVLFVLFAATEALVSEALKNVIPASSSAVATGSAAVLSGALFQPLRSWLQAKMLELLPVDPEREVLGEG